MVEPSPRSSGIMISPLGCPIGIAHECPSVASPSQKTSLRIGSNARVFAHLFTSISLDRAITSSDVVLIVVACTSHSWSIQAITSECRSTIPRVSTSNANAPTSAIVATISCNSSIVDTTWGAVKPPMQPFNWFISICQIF